MSERALPHARVIDLKAPAPATCPCGLGFVTGDIVVDYVDDDDFMASVHAYCWDEVDPDGDWFWQDEPASIGVYVAEGDQAPPRSAYAIGEFKRALEARRSEAPNAARKFNEHLGEALDACESLFHDLHRQDILSGRYLRTEDDEPEIEAGLKARISEALDRPLEPLRAHEDEPCFLCGLALVSGDIVIEHADTRPRRTPAAKPASPAKAAHAASHVHCAIQRRNETKNWRKPGEKPSRMSWVFGSLEGIRTFVAAHVPMTPSELAWRTKFHKKALKHARAALHSGLLGAWDRARHQSRAVANDSRILRNREGGNARKAPRFEIET